MTTLSLPAFLVFPWRSRTSGQMADDTMPTGDADRRRIVGEMIAAGACDSEFGIQMLMSIFPDEF
ncbi:hypothetical protein [Ovoidimarina sediminis]|uniref:hypothetical protein n=1 Tax=Ovoidimarina sediminis TaxID=3079856 RepID=UPI002910FA9B|nr:hypothetical protein [Rhodophyticola sp. MJ-SS7]MDU8942326.1 hypothetical protein [Rhodophyticola sp. MJ-SS7]